MGHIKGSLQSGPLLPLNTHSSSRSPWAARSTGPGGSGSCGQGVTAPGGGWQLQPDPALLTPATPKERLSKGGLGKNDKAFSYLIHLCCWVHSRTKAGKTQVRNSILLPFIRQRQTKPRFPGSLGSSRAPVACPSSLAVTSWGLVSSAVLWLSSRGPPGLSGARGPCRRVAAGAALLLRGGPSAALPPLPRSALPPPLPLRRRPALPLPARKAARRK